ncbi:MAG: hypothetical protein FWG90_06040 [Oscillospiraceae bacterium]|nr:hypothetical protein [Oscillospiraceae bacterium]
MKNVQLFFGKPLTSPCLIPVLHASTPTCINEPFMVGAACYRVTALSFGTAHGVVFTDNVDGIDVESLGKALGTHPLFPKGASIVFVQVTGQDSVRARLWQLGEGEKPITPEAVCAAGTAAMMNQKILKSEAKVLMDNNAYSVRWDRGRGVSLCGIPESVQVQLVDTRASA